MARLYTEKNKFREEPDFIDVITRKEGFKALDLIEGSTA